MTDQPTQPDTEVPSTDPGPVDEVPDDVPEDERGDLAEEILIEPEEYTSEPIHGIQDDLDDDETGREAADAVEADQGPAEPLEGSSGPVPHDDPDEPPAAS
jgi:hypothetical protein